MDRVSHLVCRDLGEVEVEQGFVGVQLYIRFIDNVGAIMHPKREGRESSN